MRPTVQPPPEPRALADAEVPDFLETRPLAALAFIDRGDAASLRLLDKLRHVAARLPDPTLVASIDVARHPLVAEAMGIEALPALVVFDHGALVDRVVGNPPEAVLEETLRARLAYRGRDK